MIIITICIYLIIVLFYIERDNAINKGADMTINIPNTDNSNTKVQVELSSNILKQLLKSGLLHGNDCKCLNASAKQVLWQALLTTSTDDNNDKEHYLCA